MPNPQSRMSGTNPMNPIKVLIIDDSALIRKILTRIIGGQSDMRVVGTAGDPLAAREMIRKLGPDVLTLDVEMPKMDGLDFLERLMRLRPIPVIMISTLTQQGSEVALRALELGAVDFISKPQLDIVSGLQDYALEITGKIRAASAARIQKPRTATIGPKQKTKALLPKLASCVPLTEKLIVIGASTGGTEAIKDVLMRMPSDCPAILITQHMPPAFTKLFAARLDSLCRIHVKEAEHGERAIPGHAYIAPGGRHLSVRKSGANYVVTLSDEPPVHHHRPSVEVLFRSAAQHAGVNAIGIMLTGMGKDGAAAMLDMKHAGAWNIAQDEATCVVFGMPKEAIAAGGVHEELPLGAIGARVLTLLSMGASPRRANEVS
ncbi:two-component system, chemotaxis family, response regulator CheB [Nitrosovibrio sp. Nv6]|nr:two-component system, chemotaxis family, response regulator CheB [Nitrosovibrio sp. Nv6]